MEQAFEFCEAADICTKCGKRRTEHGYPTLQCFPEGPGFFEMELPKGIWHYNFELYTRMVPPIPADHQHSRQFRRLVIVHHTIGNVNMNTPGLYIVEKGVAVRGGWIIGIFEDKGEPLTATQKQRILLTYIGQTYKNKDLPYVIVSGDGKSGSITVGQLLKDALGLKETPWEDYYGTIPRNEEWRALAAQLDINIANYE